jgi:hypothetical protein
MMSAKEARAIAKQLAAESLASYMGSNLSSIIAKADVTVLDAVNTGQTGTFVSVGEVKRQFRDAVLEALIDHFETLGYCVYVPRGLPSTLSVNWNEA